MVSDKIMNMFIKFVATMAVMIFFRLLYSMGGIAQRGWGGPIEKPRRAQTGRGLFVG